MIVLKLQQHRIIPPFNFYCVKSVGIRSYFGPYLPVFGLNKEREKCPNSELFWSVFSHIWTEYGEIRSIFPYLVRMRENTDQNNSECGVFRSVTQCYFFTQCLNCKILINSRYNFPSNLYCLNKIFVK